nr:hypothetical protein [Propionibacterium sp.]
MTPNEERRPAGNRTPNKNHKDETSVPDAADPVTRCSCCAHPLTAAASVARGFGPVCAARQSAAQLRARRESVSARLDALAARVGLLGADALAVVASGLDDVLDELGGAR